MKWLPQQSQFSPELEAAFRADFHLRTALYQRVAIPYSVLAWLCWLLWDQLALRWDPAYSVDIARVITWVRLGVGMIGVACVWATFRPIYLASSAFAGRVKLCWALAVNMGTGVLTLVFQSPFDYAYCMPGVMTTLAITCLLYLGQARSASRFALLLCVMYGGLFLVGVRVKVLPLGLGESGLYFPTMWLFCAFIALTGVFANAVVDHFARATFLVRRELEDSHLAIVALKDRLHQDSESRSQEKTRFIASAVHDLRQPVQAMSMVVLPLKHAAERGDLPRVRQLVSLSDRATRNLQEQLAAILDMSRLDSGWLRPSVMEVMLDEVLAGPLAAFEAQAAVRGVHLTISLPYGLLVHTDPMFLQRIVCNLVSNGIKYSDPSKDVQQVDVSCCVQDNCCHISVVDNGLGIDPKAIADGRIFEAFYQSNNRHAQQDKGVGLGLAIVRAMLKQLTDHHLDLHSTVSEGTTFTLSLPLSAPSVTVLST